ncbi:MAG: hypothetical protein MSD82_04770 [Prevotella sp.]|nr:hypothetical protein [Prevotella sp.]
MKLRHMILLAGMVLSLLPLTAKDFLATDFGAAGNNPSLPPLIFFVRSA